MNDFSSRTARVPARHHKRRLAISKHAIERFRERVDEEFRHRDDQDLGNLLDERLGYAEHTYEVRDPRAPDAITTLRSVACRHATLYAVVREKTVITVLDEEMAQNNFNGQWSPILNAPFTALRDFKLPLALPPAPPTPPTEVASPPNVAPAEPTVSIMTDPLAVAGAAYAHAQKRKHACAEVVTALYAELERASDELREAEAAVEESHQRLIALATDGEAP
ncbi:MAG TPA: hypothetical protein VLE97_06575 [Gaiellaceae bacterium]|nr:hypothetical protein [Gaiellaceae bacterium]